MISNTPVVAATMVLSVQLEAQQWNAVMAALVEAPYRVVAPLIESITQQLQSQAQQSPVQPGVVGNGLDINPPPEASTFLPQADKPS
jgi:hypothetical protein